jgi:hypothetical protein
MKKYSINIAVLTVIVQSVFAQMTLQKEEMVNGTYRLTYSNDGYVYFINEKDGRRYLSFTKSDDEKEKYTFPAQNLIIALPPNSHPAITVRATRQQPLQSGMFDNIPISGSEIYVVEGFFWINNSYCVRIMVHPFYFDKMSGQVAEIKELQVDIILSQSIAVDRAPTEVSAHTIIDNPKYGPQWNSKLSSYSIAQTDLWIDYNAEYVKLGVAKDGIYRLRYEDLLSFGIPVTSLNPKSIKIYVKGKEIPIYVYGENDNLFSPGDYVEFLGKRNYGDARYREVAPYGSSYFEYLNLYSDTTIYWLNWSGSDGQRIDTTLQVFGLIADTLQYYDELIHSEQNKYWDFSLIGGDLRKNDPAIYENETWNEGNLGVGQLSIPFSISELYTAKPARAFMKLQDYASDIQTNAHNLALSINNTSTLYDAGFIDKYQVKVLKAEFLSSELTNGNNTVDIHSSSTAASINTVILDWYELEYPRILRTTTDSLVFAYNQMVSPMTAVLSVTGLSDAIFSLYKFILNDSSVVKITNYSRSADTLRFVDSVANGTNYFLLKENKIPSPIFYYKKKFTNLRNTSNQADYLAITHPFFQPAASNYVAFIASSYGVTAKLIDIFDIYDEFNYGFIAPESIREFLKAAHTYWQTSKPQYVVLIGKGTYDFYGNKTRYFGAPPTPNFVPSFGNPVSDTWFVLWDSTESLIPQMSIGRIPAKDIDEFQSYANKHHNYLSKGFDDWNKRYLFFSGGNYSDPNQIALCKGTNDFIINDYVNTPPVGGMVSHFYKTADPVTNFGPYSQEYIKNAIEQGGVFISYIGHSGTQTWDNSITDVSQLANIRDRNPMITDFGCSTAKFAESDVLSFSELAVNGLQGQAISYIGNSSLGFTSTAFDFPKYFYKKLLIDTSASLGDVHRLAKIDYVKQRGTSDSYGLFIKTNTLIGDPIVKLPIPAKPNYSFANTTISIVPQWPTEQTDSVMLSLNLFNLGAVDGDSVELLVTDSYQGSMILNRTEKKPVPLFSDSLHITIPVKGKPGEHTVTITADPLNRINELYENDNSIVYHLFIASSSIRNMLLTTAANQTNGNILFLNPSVLPAQSQFIVDVSLQQSFGQSQSYTVPFDTFYTRFSLDSAYKNKRFWIRTKLSNTDYEGLGYSYYYGEKDNFLLNDSNSFSAMSTNRLKILKNTMVLDTSRILFSALSAGFNDGKTVVISRNGQNYVPENTLRGHHVCLFNATSFEFVNYYYFDIYASPSIATSYKALIDTVTSDYIVAIGISDEGAQNLSTELKASIKTLGSIYIDSLVFRGSWAIIGRKGAIPGSVPEKYSLPFEGRVSADTTIISPNTNGSFTTETLGPVSEWKNVEMNYRENSLGNIGLKVVGISTDHSLDTLLRWSVIDTVLSISAINAQHYPSIKLVGELRRGVSEPSPSVSSIAVNYTSMPELGINYQTVKCFVYQNGNELKELLPGDSVAQGDSIAIVFRTYNAGGINANNVDVKIQSIRDNTISENIATIRIDSIGKHSFKETVITYNTALGSGRRDLRITIDPDTLIKELYKDNNVFSVPIFVKSDTTQPTFDITFDGQRIYSGDYILPNPIIKIAIYDNSPLPIQDPSLVTLTLDDKRISLGTDPDSLFESKQGPEKALVTFKPKIKGRKDPYKLMVEVHDPTGNRVALVAPLYFSIDSLWSFKNVFNYPNPFASETQFTFILTEHADEVKIKIYTISGRLIQELQVPSQSSAYYKVYWDGRDRDGDDIANGIYLYKVIAKANGSVIEIIQKLAKVR